MDNILSLSTALIPLAPLVAGVISLIAAACGLRWSRSSWPGAVGSGVSCAAAAVALWRLLSDPLGTEHSWEWANWLSVGGPFSISISLGVRIDELSAMMLAAMMLVASVGMAMGVTNSRSDSDSDSEWSPLAAPFVIFGGAMVILSPNLLQLIFFWQFTAFVTFAVAADQQENSQSAAASRKAFLIGRLGDIPLVFGFLLFWFHFGSPNWLDVLAKQFAAEGDPEKLQALSAVGICLLGGVMARCAQFPLLGWLEDFAASARPSVLLWELMLLMPTGVYLIARFAGVFVISEALQLATLAVGGFTAFLAAMSAASAPDARRAIAYTSASLCGWVLQGFAAADIRGIDASIRLLLLSILGTGMLMCGICCGRGKREVTIRQEPSSDRSVGKAANNTVPRGASLTKWLMSLGVLLMVTGCWGQSAILTSLWEAAGSTSRSADSLWLINVERKILLVSLLCLDTVALFLLALGIFRAIFMMSFAGDASEPGFVPTAHGRFAVVGLTALIAAAALLSPLGIPGWQVIERISERAWPQFGSAPAADLYSVGFGLPPALMGVVTAWMLFGPGAQQRPSGQVLFRPFVRWSRSRYFLDDFFFLFLELPIRGLAQFSRFIDWFLIDGLIVQIPARFPADVAKLARPLQQGSAQFYALGIFVAAAVLLAAMLWLRG